MTLEELVIAYQSSRLDTDFESIYNQVYSQRMDPITRVGFNHGIYGHDARALVDDKIMETVDYFTIKNGSYLTLVNAAIKYGAIDIYRKEQYQADNVQDVLVPDDEEDYDGVYIEQEIYEAHPVEETTTEDDIINHVINNLDQRNLIAMLLLNADETTKQTIDAFQNTDTFRQAAKLIGTCHKTVKARIQRLRRGYDVETYGDPADYLITPTSSK